MPVLLTGFENFISSVRCISGGWYLLGLCMTACLVILLAAYLFVSYFEIRSQQPGVASNHDDNDKDSYNYETTMIMIKILKTADNSFTRLFQKAEMFFPGKRAHLPAQSKLFFSFSFIDSSSFLWRSLGHCAAKLILSLKTELK